MSHKCEAALITCEDFRLHQRKDGRNYIADFIKEKGVDCDVITRGGGVQDLVRPRDEGFKASLLRDSEVSTKLHNCSFIYLVNHEDCGAYGSMEFSNRDEELDQHKSDLLEAKRILSENFPGTEVEIYFGYLKPETEDKFDIQKID